MSRSAPPVTLAAAPAVVPPRSVQEKMIALIVATAARHGLEAVVAADCSNTGAILLQAPDDFVTVAEILYDFQFDTMGLRMTVRGRPVVAARHAGRKDGYVDWYMRNSASGEIREFLMVLDLALGR